MRYIYRDSKGSALVLRRLICFLILLPTLSLAIELGPVQVRTPLYQPLQATIAVEQLHNIPVKELQVSLASNQAFKDAGLVKTHLLQQLQFTIVANKKGGATIDIQSSKPIQEPYLSLLLKLSWLQGDFVKKYTLLLDPPAQVEAMSEAKTTLTVEKAQSKPVQHQRASQQRVYGPTKHYETLWQVAKKLRPSKSVTLPQTMLAIASLNPNAFQKHNINGLMSGFHLKVPTLAQIKSIPKAQAERDLHQHKLFWQKKKTVKLPKLPIAKPVKLPAVKQTTVLATPPTKTELSKTANKAMEPSEAIPPVAPTPRSGAIDVLPAGLANMQKQLQKVLLDNKRLLEQNQQLQQKIAQLQRNKQALQQPTVAEKRVTPATRVQTSSESSAPAAVKPSVMKPPVVTINKPKTNKPGIFTVLMDFWWQILVILALLVFLIIWRIIRKRSNKPKPGPLPDTSSEDIGPELETELVQDDEPRIEVSNMQDLKKDEAIAEENVDVNSILPEVTVKEVRRKKPTVELESASPEEVLHEAKLYIDYGRNEQAKAMLEAVAASEPADNQVWEDLLTLYASLNDSKGLAAMITKIPPELLNDEQSSLWKKITMLRDKGEKSAIDMIASAITEDIKADDEAEVEIDIKVDNEIESASEQITLESVVDEAPVEEQIELTLLDEPAAANDTDTAITAEPVGGDETQLDLATAYIAMGDKKAAKKILLKLLQSEDAAIKNKAEALLATFKD
jgi:pilus assembly protein FimV